MRGGRAKQLHLVDGQLMTIDDVAAMLGVTKHALYVRKHKLGRCSYQLIVDMCRRNEIGSDNAPRYLIEGRWMTQTQIAEMLRVSPHTLTTWRSAHGRAPMEDAVAYYRQYLTGELVRGRNNGGGRQWKEHIVNGRVWTVKDVMARYGVGRTSVYKRLYALGHDFGRMLDYYEEKAARRRERERKKMAKAARDIMKIIGY